MRVLQSSATLVCPSFQEPLGRVIFEALGRGAGTNCVSPVRRRGRGYRGEWRIFEALKPISPRCAFDVGANKGDWCLLMADLHLECKIHAFELVPSTFQELQKTVGSNPNIVLNNFGLFDENATITMNFSDADSSTATALPHQGDEISRPVLHAAGSRRGEKGG